MIVANGSASGLESKGVYNLVPGQQNLTTNALKYYLPIYQSLDPLVMSERTNLRYDSDSREFCFTLAGFGYRASWPDFTMTSIGGHPDGNDYERILVIRYLCEGQFAPATGKEWHYRDMPSANTYEQCFNGRVSRRLIKGFSKDLESLRAIMEGNNGFQGELLDDNCDLGYRFDLLDGLPVSLRFWREDDEFPASVVLLFDSSLQFAFSAEDLAVAGGILVDHLMYCRKQVS
ncbi:MAG: DUF3786 domain-containing protein [Actinomycetia bacterium]|nr:DUF3786 domain-containing protein [Actinomycetes bacterium]